jgi:pimeloyl-ACP methyl ester carboxylesterase
MSASTARSIHQQCLPVSRSVLRDMLECYSDAGSINTRCVVFVHGLTGNIKTTWLATEGGASFLQLIASDKSLQDYDVYSFGYRSKKFRGAPIEYAAVQLQRAIDNIVTAARIDSIVLVAHSMGGLVCMRYIINQLSLNKKPPITGLLLYGVPSTGSEMINYAKAVGFGIAIKVPIVRGVMNLFFNAQRQIADLATGSKFLADLHDQWALRVVNGGHEGAGPGRMWLPVRVVTGEDDIFVSEASGKGLYGAIDWLPIPSGHVALVKPSERDDIRYVQAKSFLQFCRQAKAQDVLGSLWEASQDIWKLRVAPVIERLNFRSFFGAAAGGSGYEAALATCTTVCEYDMILEGDDVEFGITLGDQASSEIWNRSPMPVYIHQIGVSLLPEQERNNFRKIIDAVLNSGTGTDEDVSSWLFPKVDLSMDGHPLNPRALEFEVSRPRERSNWALRKYAVPDAVRSKLGRRVRLHIQYDSYVPLSLGYFVFTSPWIINGATVRVVISGKFEYFNYNYRLIPPAKADLREQAISDDAREVSFVYPRVLIPGSAVEVRWQRRRNPTAASASVQPAMAEKRE